MAQLRYKVSPADRAEIRATSTRSDEKAGAAATGDDRPEAGASQARLAFLTGQYPRATDTFIQREVAMLRSLGYHVQTFSIRKPPATENVSAEVEAIRKSTIYLLPPANLLQAHLAQLISSPRRYLSALSLALRTCPPGFRALVRQAAYFAESAILASFMRRHSLSHLHNHFSDSSCSVAAMAAELGGFTFSFTMHGPAEFLEPRLWWIDEKIRRAVFVNCISHFCRSQAMLFSPVDCWNKLMIVHCGVEPHLFELRQHAGRGNKLLFVGRLAAAKGLPILLDAIAKLDDATLDIAGDGPDRLMLVEQARRLGISERVRFLGYQSQAQVRDLLKESDIFVLTSFAEGVPVVLMEAMAAGVPVITTRIAGIPELVQDGESGLLIPPGDAGATAAAIRQLADDPSLRTRLAAAGRKKVEQEFDVEAEAHRFAGILARTLATRAR
jgi:colanic acid/amylovoran biosynthesis glycosyltransferase